MRIANYLWVQLESIEIKSFCLKICGEVKAPLRAYAHVGGLTFSKSPFVTDPNEMVQLNVLDISASC